MIQRYKTFLEIPNFFALILAVLDKLVKKLDKFLYVFRQTIKFFTLFYWYLSMFYINYWNTICVVSNVSNDVKNVK